MEIILALLIGFICGSICTLFLILDLQSKPKGILKRITEPKQKAQFFEPVTNKEKFDKSNNITDLLNE